MYNKDKKFDIDLKYGNLKEQQVADMLQSSKIEVKTERGMWKRTGNIAIEFRSYGKPSGIDATEADYWFHVLADGDDIDAVLMFEVKKLRAIVAKGKWKTIRGGDNYGSEMYLVPLSKLMSAQTLSTPIEEAA